ncbi:uncharacterized protein PG986_008846 [Apiospora aurea]|uniref:Fungal N-terminal domain-containing protein n=1 Tax=Apiospora aurea TaxID=335848 RepID=A0ABR1Q604_9PEZI
MAEVLGVVSGAAGLTSLVLQVASGTSRLRKAYKLTKKVPVEVGMVARDLDFICEVAKRLNCTDSQTGQADLIVAHCISSIQALAEAIDALSQRASDLDAQKGLKTSAQRLKWMSSCQDDLESLRKLAHDAKVNLMLLGQLGMLQPSISPPLQPPQLVSTNDGPSPNIFDTSTSLQTRSNRGRGRQSCLKRCCTCRCHIKGSVRHRFWAFKYTPLSMILGNCDNPMCDGRQYMYSFRVALSQLGFPWAVTAAIGIQREADGYSIGLTLRPQYIVRYTSPGFELLHSVKKYCITLDEGISRFTEMYLTDPSFIHHIDPSGKGYIENLMSDWSLDIDDVVSLLRLFIANFNMTQGLDNINFYLVLLDELVNLGFDPASLEEPDNRDIDRGLDSGSLGHLYFEVFQKIIPLDPDFGNTSSAHREIFHNPARALMTLRRSPENLDATSNFLGQTPLHLAIMQNDSELARALLDAGHPLDALDWCGRSPLDYTAMLGYSGCAKSLLSEGADLAYALSSVDGPAFIEFALLHKQRDYLVEVLQHIQTSIPDDKRQSLCSFVAKQILSGMAHCGPSYFLRRFSYDDITALVIIVDEINLELVGKHYRRDSEWFEPLHCIWPLKYVKIFVEHGYTGFNRKDRRGTTPLMVAAYEGIPALVQYYIGMNALVNDQDNVGSTSLMKALGAWLRCRNAIRLSESHDYPAESAEKHAQLDAEMRSIEGLGFQELKNKWFHQILKSYDKQLSNRGRLHWKEELDLFNREARPVERPGPPVPGYTINYRNDSFEYTYRPDSLPKWVLQVLVWYMADLVKQTMDHSEDRHEDLEEVDDRRMLWVAELMEVMEIPMSLLQEESRRDWWIFHYKPDGAEAAISYFVNITAKLLSKRSA